MLLTDDPQIARLVQEDSKTEAGLVKWFFVDKMPKISSGHFVRSRLHREDDFICTFVPVEIAIRVATFMNQNVHYFRPDEHPEILAEKLEEALMSGWLSLGSNLH